MRSEKFNIAFLVSALAHAAIFGTILYVAYNGSIDVPGDDGVGETIAVSLVSPEGVVRATPQASPKKSATPVFVPTRTASKATSSPTETTSALAGTNEAAQRTGSSPKRGKGDPRLMKMWRKINRSKYYPLNARRNSLNGNPRVTFKTGEQGQVEYVKLAKSCGITELDDAAIETVKRAAPLPYYPKPITLTIRYSIKD